MENNDICYVKSVPASVIDVLCKIFAPYKLSNPDLICAFVYLHTGGQCEVSDKARAAAENAGIKSYDDIVDRLEEVHTMLKEITATDNAVEIGVTNILTDRLFGLGRSFYPNQPDLHGANAVDMLKNIRKAGKIQAEIDNKTKGKEINSKKKKKKK